jgi:two-component system nitrogen regulation response regulator NtrX
MIPPMASPATLVVIDDERNVRRTLAMVLEDEGHEVDTFGTAEEGLARLGEGGVSAVIMDIQLPGISGVEALRRLKERESDVPVIVVSGHASLEEAAEATRLGAYDFMQKPLDRERVLVSVRNALESRGLKAEVRDLRERVRRDDEMLGESDALLRLRAAIAKVAPTRGRVLITGESGTGKELVARAIHAASERSRRAFVKVNCAAIPKDLIESELFGHERGAFTGATTRRKGKFAQADGGTILLDEIGDMAPDTQAKVLRVLETGEVQTVGGDKLGHVDARVIAATNRDLKAEVKAGRFREDLLYRLNVVPLLTPPLRARKGDVPLLVRHFVGRFCAENGLAPSAISAGALAAMDAYAWPGNVRELKNLCERLVIMGGDPIDAADLPEEILGPGPRFDASAHATLSLREFREAMEREYLVHILGRHDWNVTRASAALGIERTNLHKKMRSLGMSRADS